MSGGLLVVLPTRSRPESARRFTEAFHATIASDKTSLMLVLDDDDDDSRAGLGGLDVASLTIPRAPLTVKLNHAAGIYAPHYAAMLFCGDDNVPRTTGWDMAMMGALAGGQGMVYANDLIRNDVPCSVLITSGIVEALGWFANPALNHFYIDNTWADLGAGAGCLTYLPHVIIEHLHPAGGKAPSDALYEETRARWWDADEAAYAVWRAGQMEADVEKVKKAIL